MDTKDSYNRKHNKHISTYDYHLQMYISRLVLNHVWIVVYQVDLTQISFNPCMNSHIYIYQVALIQISSKPCMNTHMTHSQNLNWDNSLTFAHAKSKPTIMLCISI